MTIIYSMSAGFMQAYMAVQGKDKLDMEEVFKKLSYELGGDGKSIKKEDLDSYINQADKGLIKVDSAKLNALKRIQKNWDNISGGDDTITLDEMQKYSAFLMATMNGNFTETEIGEDDSSSISDAIYDYLTDYLGKKGKNEITESDLSNYLNELLADETDDIGANDELVCALTNMIASYSSISTIETEA